MSVGKFSHFLEVGGSLFFSLTGETNSGLTSSSVLFGELHSHSLEDFSGVSLEGGVEDTATVNNDESEFFVIIEEIQKQVWMEGVIAEVFGGSDWLERLEINVDFLFSLSVLQQNNTAKHNKSIFGSSVVQLQSYTQIIRYLKSVGVTYSLWWK